MAPAKTAVFIAIAALMVLAIGLCDYLTGTEMGFFVFYYPPIIFASWTLGRWSGLATALLAAVVWYIQDRLSQHQYSQPWLGEWNSAIRLISFGVISYFSSWAKMLLRREQGLVAELQKAMSEVKELSGLLPICASCKKVRNDRGYWEQIESYIQKRTKADFSHSICPDCRQKLYPQAAARKTEDPADEG